MRRRVGGATLTGQVWEQRITPSGARPCGPPLGTPQGTPTAPPGHPQGTSVAHPLEPAEQGLRLPGSEGVVRLRLPLQTSALCCTFPKQSPQQGSPDRVLTALSGHCSVL